MADDAQDDPPKSLVIQHAAMPPTVIRGGKTFWSDVAKAAFIAGGGLQRLTELADRDIVEYMKITDAIEKRSNAAEAKEPSSGVPKNIVDILDQLPVSGSSSTEQSNAGPAISSEESQPNSEAASEPRL